MTRLDQEISTRKTKLKNVIKQGFEGYPSNSKRSHNIKKSISSFSEFSQSNKKIYLVGRIKSIRLHGGSCFANIEDGSGLIQIYLKKDIIGEKTYSYFNQSFDIGDFIEIYGKLITTRKGEKTLNVEKLKLLTKSLLPLPEKWHGLSDIEIRYRKRYLDLISNPDVKLIFEKKSKLISTIRNFLDDNGFLEVETPILQSIPGGANARPFKTHHNSLNMELYLRIAPELYLKKLIIGGFEKVYEIAKCFRNEGIDRDHNPEFTQVEFYAAYWDYIKMMNFTEKLMEAIVMNVNNNINLKFETNQIDFAPPYQKITFKDACSKYGKIDIEKSNKDLLKEIKSKKIIITKPITRAKLLDEIFKELVRPNLIQPTFVMDHPIELSPLAKKKADNPNYVERFQLVIAQKELCNAFSELNDPQDQEERFKFQEKMRSSGDEEAQRIDTEYIEALAHGMPPTAGIGIGIDRLANILTNTHNIKEVILFPILKSK